MRAPYTLYKRNVNGGIIWYYTLTFFDSNGKKVRKSYSTGLSGKTAAHVYVTELYKDGKLEMDTGGALFSVYFKDWWIDGKCPYQREQLRNGAPIGLEHMASGRSIMIRYLMPAFGKRKMSSLTTPLISEWRYSLVEKHGLGNRTANSYMTYLRDMMDFAWRHNVIPENPCLRIKALHDNCVQRGVLSRSEASRLLSDTTLWDSRLAYIANYTAALTGMRISEIIALQGEDIFPDHIHCVHSIASKTGLKCTKTGGIRDIPVTPVLYGLLSSLVTEPDRYLFTLGNPDKPVYRWFPLDHLRLALEKMGVSREEQDARKLCFHSWRYFLNTQMRASGVPDAVVQKMTGHATMEMTEHYTHIGLEESRCLERVQERLVVTSAVTSAVTTSTGRPGKA